MHRLAHALLWMVLWVKGAFAHPSGDTDWLPSSGLLPPPIITVASPPSTNGGNTTGVIVFPSRVQTPASDPESHRRIELSNENDHPTHDPDLPLVNERILRNPERPLLEQLASNFHPDSFDNFHNLFLLDVFDSPRPHETAEALIAFWETLQAPQLRELGVVEDAFIVSHWNHQQFSTLSSRIVAAFNDFLSRHPHLQALSIWHAGRYHDVIDFPDMRPTLEQIQRQTHLVYLDISAPLMLGPSPVDHAEALLRLHLPSLETVFLPQSYRSPNVDWLGRPDLVGPDGALARFLGFHTSLRNMGVDLRWLDLDSLQGVFRGLGATNSHVRTLHLYHADAGPLAETDHLPHITDAMIRSVATTIWHRHHLGQEQTFASPIEIIVGGIRYKNIPTRAGSGPRAIQAINSARADRILTALSGPRADRVSNTLRGFLFDPTGSPEPGFSPSLSAQMDIMELRWWREQGVLPNIVLEEPFAGSRPMRMHTAIEHLREEWSERWPGVSFDALMALYQLFFEMLECTNPAEHRRLSQRYAEKRSEVSSQMLRVASTIEEDLIRDLPCPTPTISDASSQTSESREDETLGTEPTNSVVAFLRKLLEHLTFYVPAVSNSNPDDSEG